MDHKQTIWDDIITVNCSWPMPSIHFGSMVEYLISVFAEVSYKWKVVKISSTLNINGRQCNMLHVAAVVILIHR